jgi:hypothetical protein
MDDTPTTLNINKDIVLPAGTTVDGVDISTIAGAAHVQNTDTNMGVLAVKPLALDADKFIIRDSAAGDVFSTTTGAQLKTYLGGIHTQNTDWTLVDSAGGADLIDNGYIVSDMRTDRWMSNDSNTFFGVDVAGTDHLTDAGGGSDATNNTAYGNGTVRDITTGHDNTALGYRSAVTLTSGYDNTIVGADAGASITTTNANTVVGHQAFMNGTGGYNSVLGSGALAGAAGGDWNTSVGILSLNDNTGDQNVAVGAMAGDNYDGSGSVFIGYRAGDSAAASNVLYITNTNDATPLIYGDFATDTVTINNDLSMAGDIIMTGGATVDGVDISTLAGGHVQGTDTTLGTMTADIDMDSHNLDNVGTTYTSMLQVGAATPIFPLYTGSGFMSQLQIDGTAILRSADWSVSQLNYGDGATIPEHTGTGSYDYTGGTVERLFTATAAVFDNTDDDGKMILLLSGAHVGAVVEIEHYISTTEVQVTSDNGWDADLAGETFGILPTPTFGIANSGSARFSMGGESTLAMRSLNATAAAPVSVQVINGGNDVSAFEVDVLNSGYTNNEAIDINFNTGAMPAGSHASILKISADKSSATSSTTTGIDYINISQVGKNSTLSTAVHVGAGFDTAFNVAGGTRIDPSYGYTVTAAHAVTDRIAAFIDPATNVQMFTADNSYILLGSTATFESIPVYLNTVASSTIVPAYYYSNGDGTWATLVVSDTTTGFTTNGIISFNAPAAWATTTKVTPAGAAITSGYYVKIVRTRNSLSTPPTESYFKLYTSSSVTDFKIRGDGTIMPVHMTDASAPNDSIYYSTTSSKLSYKDPGGSIHDLY